MTSVLSAITKLPRFKVVLDKNDDKKQRNRLNYRKYYQSHKKLILQKKWAHNRRPEVKKKSKDYHHNYYLIHREEIYKKHLQYLRSKKNGMPQMSQANS